MVAGSGSAGTSTPGTSGSSTSCRSGPSRKVLKRELRDRFADLDRRKRADEHHPLRSHRPRHRGDLKEYPTISDEALREAIGRADRAHSAWSVTPPAERGALVRRLAELHTERRAELAAIIGREMGKPVSQALGEVDYSARIYAFYADKAEELAADEPIEISGSGSAVLRRESFGALLGIMPWNFPYYQVARFAGPNLAIGNTIVLKHAPQCPESAAAIAAHLRRRRLPRGLLRERQRDQRADRVGDRRPSDPRRLGHRLRAGGRRGRRNRRSKSEEGRARARRLGPVHRPRQ